MAHAKLPNDRREALTEHEVGTHEEFDATREELLAEEKALTRRGDQLARKRRELPWVAVDEDYRFETEHGTRTLADLFEGRSQRLVLPLHVRPVLGGGLPGLLLDHRHPRPPGPHLKARDTTLLLASRAPLERLLAYRERMGWRIEWVPSGGQRLQP